MMMKSDNGGLIQLAAYVVIFVIMGIVTVVKKMAEAQKRRAAEEKKAGEHTRPTIAKGLRPDKPAPARIPEPLPPVMTEPYPQPAEEPLVEDEEEVGEEKEGVEIEDILRKALGLPSSEQKPRSPIPLKPKPIVSEKTVIPQQEPTAEPSLEPAAVASAAEEFVLEPDRVADKQGWSDFLGNLEAKELNQLQQAIIFSEIITPPIAFRRGRRITSFWPR